MFYAFTKIAIWEEKMARIFISHSSHDNEWAIRLRNWLATNGWDDVFLDIDPRRGIAAGQRWMEALQKAAHRCEVVIVMLSPHWLASEWSKAELNAARMMSKKVIVLLVGAGRSEVPVDLREDQWVDLVHDPVAFLRLKEGLKRAGLDPSSFPFEPGRRPYPGFAPLEEADAAIFFGRDAQIVRGLDRMRGLSRAGIERMLVILGASGVGKSSYLKAGLWPRLKRDDRTWLPLPTIRPENSVISGKFGLAQAIYRLIQEPPFSQRLKDGVIPQTRAAIEDYILKRDEGLPRILAILRDLAQVHDVSAESPPPTVVIPIDQGEELFNEDGSAEARRFIDILVKSLKADQHVLVLLALRSDSFPQFQANQVLAGCPKDTFTLDMMLEGSYRAVIEGPAQLAEPPLSIDPQLTDALLRDVSGQDALPLLAFTLAHLYERHRVGNELNLANYKALGGLKGVIETTVKQAILDGISKDLLPKDPKAQLTLIRKAFVPHLARIMGGHFVRHLAKRSEIPPESRAILDRLAEARLLVKDRRQIGSEEVEVIEVAHEALLREWRDLNGILQEEREFLVAKDQIEQDLAEWRAASEQRKKGALLTGNKLARTSDWLLTRPEDLRPEERHYIEASVHAEKRRRRQRVALAGSAFALISTFAALAGWNRLDATRQKHEAVRQQELRTVEARKKAEIESTSLAALSDIALKQGQPVDAVRLALAAWPRKGDEKRPQMRRVITALVSAMSEYHERARLEVPAARYAAFSPDGKRVITASEDNKAHIWDAETGEHLTSLIGHDKAVWSAAFSSDGARAVTASDDGTARIWNAETGEELLAVINRQGASLRRAAFSPDSARIVTASIDNMARIWDANTGKQLVELRGHGGEVYSAAFSPDGERIVTASLDKAARIWDARTGKPLVKPLKHRGEVYSAAFGRDGTRIVTASEDGTVGIWNAKTGEADGQLTTKGKDDKFSAAAFSPDGVRIVTASYDFRVRIWDVGTKRVLIELKGHDGVVNSAAFSADGTHIVTASDDNTARIWDTPAVPLVALGHEDSVNKVAFSSDGTHIVTASRDKTARIWNARTGALLTTIPGRKGAFKGDLGAMATAAFDPQGDRVVTASDYAAVIWNAKTGEPLITLDRQKWFLSAAFSPDGSRIVTVAEDKTARIWDAKTGEQLQKLEHPDQVTFAEFSRPDGARIVTASADKKARVWDAKTGELLKVLDAHGGSLRGAAFSPDGGHIVTASDDGTARVWNARTGEVIAVLRGHSKTVWSAAFDRDGARVITGSQDKTAGIWNAETGELLAVLRGHDDGVNDAAFSPDGAQIVTASSDKTVRIWNDVQAGDAFAAACAALRNKTDLADLARRYGLAELKPVCGSNAPNKANFNNMPD
jgi:WD40 repeat protein